VSVRAAVLRTAGTNCDAETVHALKRAGAAVDLVHLHAVMRAPQRLADYRIVLFPGGFTYGDDIASGVVFATEMRDRVLPELRKRIADGALVLGICNGFQILVRAGLLPDTDGSGEQTASLQPNVSGKFECRWVRLEATTDQCVFLEKGQIIECPVAHMEGRFVTDEALRSRLAENGQLALRYTAPDGGDAEYPWNPNGSRLGIAGVCDPTGRVLGLMPHPERNVETWHHPHWTRGTAGGAGLSVFTNAVKTARGDA
jgi:phosphoribosylformylglycinamidine synthase